MTDERTQPDKFKDLARQLKTNETEENFKPALMKALEACSEPLPERKDE